MLRHAVARQLNACIALSQFRHALIIHFLGCGRRFRLRFRSCGFRRLQHSEFQASKLDNVAILQQGFGIFQARIIDKGAIGRVQVLHPQRLLFQQESRMLA